MCDEEGTQGKAWSYLFRQCKIRGAMEPEICHPLYNAQKNAINDWGERGSILKLTHICNYNHGAFLSGDRLLTRQEAFGTWLSKQSEDYLQELHEKVCEDNDEEVLACQTRVLIDEFLKAPCIAKRLPFVKNKTIFGINAGSRLALKQWSLHQESGRALVDFLFNSGESQNNNSVQQEADGENSDSDGEKNEPEPETNEVVKTRAELLKIYAGRGPHRMFAEFTADDHVRHVAATLEFIGRALESRCFKDMDAQRKGSEAQLQYLLERATGSNKDSWWETVADILLARHDACLVDVLRMTPQCTPPVSLDSELVTEDIKQLESAMKYSDCLASRVAWSQLIFRFTLPFAAMFMVSTSKQVRAKGMRHLKAVIETVLKLQDAVIAGDEKCQLVLNDIYWADEALSIEIMALSVQSDYDSNLLALRSLMRRYGCGTSCTFDLLEKCFSHLSDIVKRHNRSLKCRAYALWLYATTSAYVRTAGVQQILPTYNDFLRTREAFSEKSEMKALFNQSFRLESTPLPEIQLGEPGAAPNPLTKSSLLLHRTCGPTGHHRAAAAMAYAMHDSTNGFQNKDRAWVGNPVHGIQCIT